MHVTNFARLVWRPGCMQDYHVNNNHTFVSQNLIHTQSISDAVDTLLPSLPPTLTSSLSVQGQTFVDSTFYLPYLPYAPQKALANIFSVYRRYSDTLYYNNGDGCQDG